ncbi:uncharacterized protein PHALS_14903 [Plasmopara halstedii]|uniref:Uncharacterized protein n=1 Tax=Plasmopara halstedii TaxID=4781 RepID=A0A0P1AVZ8_PLAHL|nr:uncharacterized protein PHALS_14903 [Plasmopara halstedii]CEG46573.1 hypothetical protein PHALS_14903 [Plasmopara halstedii]|eukprot:XP_024582942.1 hypothetical protein PHALS_14903 [Plasmopara halstedii]
MPRNPCVRSSDISFWGSKQTFKKPEVCRLHVEAVVCSNEKINNICQDFLAQSHVLFYRNQEECNVSVFEYKE